MAQTIIRAAVVGASSLLGKELAEQLNESAATQWDLTLLDKEEASGQVTAAGDEALILQPVSSESFTGMDMVFFAGDATTTRENWRAAVDSGANVIDLTGVLSAEENVSVRSPLVRSATSAANLDISSIATISAHPAAIMLGTILGKLHAAFSPIQVSATVLEPASQQGSEGLDEMQQQAVNILTFKALPQEIFDAQVAFNLLRDLGDSARANLAASMQIVRKHLALISGQDVAKAVTLQMIHAPVFNGYTASIFVATASPIKQEEIERVLNSDIVRVPASDDPPVSNQAVAQEAQILVQVRPSQQGEPGGFWLWVAADNIGLAARNAVACAADMIALRPGAPVQ